MRLRVEMRPGDDKGQRVLTENGEIVEGVKSIQWHADASEPKLVVTFYPQKVDFDIRNRDEIEA